MARISVIHGPNLDLLGVREPGVYGDLTLGEIDVRIREEAPGHEIRSFQSNSEGAIIDRIHDALGWADGIVINPAAYTHTSYAIRDAIAAVSIPTVEVHISNIEEREPFRRVSVIEDACIARIHGHGWRSYVLGIEALLEHLGKAG
jgi:3-dehydroquinate dehydratase-2